MKGDRMDTERKHLMELLQEFDTGMLVTRDEQSPALRSRPMHVAKVEDSGDLWFISGKESHKTQEIRQDDNVLLTFQKGEDCYISLAGKARVVQDRHKLDELWKDEYKTWFPEGKEDPELALVHVRANDAEYWDNEGLNKLAYAFQSVQALASNTQPEVQRPKQFGHVDF